MKQELEALKKEVNDKHIEALAKIEALEKGLGKTEFKVGDWVYRISGDVSCNTVGKIQELEAHHTYPILLNECYGTDYVSSLYCNKVRLATEEEIKTHLIAEAKRRIEDKGNIKGIRIIEANENWNGANPSHNSYHINHSSRLGSTFFYNSKTDTLYNWGYGLAVIYEAGQWATIVEQDPVIKIGGLTADFSREKGCVWFDGNQYTDTEIQKLVDVLSNHKSQIKSLNVGCSGQHKATLDDLNQILSRLK